MSEYILTYFNGEGLGEAIRMLLAFGNIEFEDKRIEDEEWEEMKGSEWVKIWEKLKILKKIVKIFLKAFQFFSKVFL